MKTFLKQAAFQGISVAERALRGRSAGNRSPDAAELKGVRNFVLPMFEPYLGSLVHNTPLVEALRTAVPDSRIIVTAAPLACQVFQHHPMIDRLVATPDPNRNFRAAVAGMRKIVAQFGSESWCALFTNWNSRTRVALAVMLSGGGVRAGYCVAPTLLHLGLQPDYDSSQIARNLRILQALGHNSPSHLEPRVYFNQNDLDCSEGLIGGSSRGPVAVLITRTSGGQPTAWPDSRWVAVARHLIAEHKCRIVLPGTKAEADALSRLAVKIGAEATSLAGKTTIAQLAAVCALSDIVIAVDTGPMHVARSQGMPLAIIAPAWQSSIEWMPIDKPWARILKGPWFPAPPPPSYAIEEVTAEHVAAAADELLGFHPPQPSARLQRIRRSLVAPEVPQPV